MPVLCPVLLIGFSSVDCGDNEHMSDCIKYVLTENVVWIFILMKHIKGDNFRDIIGMLVLWLKSYLMFVKGAGQRRTFNGQPDSLCDLMPTTF